MADGKFVPIIGWLGFVSTLILKHANELVALCIGIVTLGYMLEKFRLQRRRRKIEETQPFPLTKQEKETDEE